MTLFRHRIGSMLLPVVVLALVAAGPVAAAEPPAGVVLDATVTVTVVADQADGSVAQPLEGAAVVLRAVTNDFPDDPIQELTGTTDAAGVATFEGVARADAGGPEVFLSAEASIESSSTDGECIVTESWFGIVGDVPSSDGLDIPVTALPSSSIVCPPPDNTLPEGLVADASLELAVTFDGAPVEAIVTAAISRDGWVTFLEAATQDGIAVIDAIARPDDGGAPVDVLLTATASIPDAINDCAFERVAEGNLSLTIDAAGLVQATMPLELAPFDAPDQSQSIAVVERTGGAPVAGSGVFVLQTHPGAAEPWGCHAVTGADGQVTVPIYNWGTPGAPSIVSFEIYGPITSTEVRGECVLSFGHVGQGSLTQEDGVVAEIVTIETDIMELDEVCSTTGTPEPPVQAPGAGAGGAVPTLPPTDALFGTEPTTSPLLPAVLALLAALALAVAFTVPVRRRR